MPRYADRAALAVCLLLAAPTQPAEAKGEKSWDTASSIGAYGLAGFALGLPIVDGDTKGALQAGGSIAAAELVAFGLKKAFPELRPDRSDRKSFPSGHTSVAFAAAATAFNREGASAGVPAMAIAAFVGVARVKAEKHHWYDCVAGAGIGTASGLLLTHDRDRRAALIPWGDTKSGGVAFAMRF